MNQILSSLEVDESRLRQEERPARNIPYNSALSLAHFDDPAFINECREMFRHLYRGYPEFPAGRERAKVWESVQGWRALRDQADLSPTSQVLGVGAGFEPLVFWLTKYCGRVFATDLYAADLGWNEADAAMLRAPAAFCPQSMPFEERRLVVQHMDALDLKYEDASFEAVFSCGSIEHFGTLENVARAAAEMGRVLKPGGILSLSTEYRLSGPDGIGIPGVILFTPEMLDEFIVAASGLELVDEFKPFDSDVAEYAYPLAEAVQGNIRQRSICLSDSGYVWTSVSLCLRKPR